MALGNESQGGGSTHGLYRNVKHNGVFKTLPSEEGSPNQSFTQMILEHNTSWYNGLFKHNGQLFNCAINHQCSCKTTQSFMFEIYQI